MNESGGFLRVNDQNKHMGTENQSLSLSFCLCLFLSLPLYLSLSLTVAVSVPLFLLPFLYLSLCPSLSHPFLYICVTKIKCFSVSLENSKFKY